jgi:endonuclease YncB( thermonuclease family)
MLAGAALFALGVLGGSVLRPVLLSSGAAPALAATAAELPPATEVPLSRRLDAGIAYPAEVIRILDGDTFEARVRVWPGLDVDTKVRLRGIDAAELHARCAEELSQAQAARSALETILGEGGVTISRVGIDKYGGRVDAAVATSSTADVSAAMLNGGYARSYDGRKRGSWC